MSSPEEYRLPIHKPLSTWWERIGFDYRRALVALGQAAISGSAHKGPEALGKLIEALSSFQLKSLEPGELAWVLITRSMIRAIWGLVPLSGSGVLAKTDQEVREVCSKIDLTFERELYVIDASFFEAPSNLPLLRTLLPSLSAWLSELFLDKRSFDELLSRLQLDFVEALHTEWASNPEHFEPIRNAFRSPFIDDLVRQSSWREYGNRIKQELTHSPLDSKAPLSKCFVPLRGYVSRRNDPLVRSEVRDVVEVLSELHTWLNLVAGEFKMRLLSGGLGAGKTSVAKMLIHQLNEASLYKALFLEIESMNVHDDLRGAIEAAAAALSFPDILSAKRGENHLLIVLDGLEDYDGSPEDFIKHADELCETLNVYGRKVRILITAKSGILGSMSGRFQRSGRIISLLPHFISDADKSQYSDPRKLLAEDRRKTWCEKYSEATGTDTQSLLDGIMANAQLSELSAQPLVLHLLAISKTLTATPPPRQVELTTVYRQLLLSVHEKSWKQGWSQAGDLSFDEYCRVFEELAWEMWQKGEKTISLDQTRAAILAMPKPFPHLRAETDEDVVRLLGDFFLTEVQASEDGSQTFAFVHGGFLRYLLSRRIIREVEDISHAISNQSASQKQAQILHRWLLFSGATALSSDCMEFLRSEMRLRQQYKIRLWCRNSLSLLTWAMQVGSDLPMIKPEMGFWDMHESIRNSNECLFAVVHSCGTSLNEPVSIVCDQPDQFGRWLHFIMGQRKGRENRLILSCLEGFDFSSCRDLLASDFMRASSQGTVFSSVNLRWSLFRDADLKRSHFEDADLRNCDFEGADLRGAILTGALCQGANFRWANLEETDLRECDFEGADFSGARMKGARCADASFQSAVLINLDCEFRQIIDFDPDGSVQSYSS